MDTSSSTPSKVTAILIFCLSALVLVASIKAVQDKVYTIAGAMIGLSYLLILIGRQRIYHWKLGDREFRHQIFIGALIVAILSAVGAATI